MKCGHALLLLGALVAVAGAFPAGSCDGYTNISQAWRNANFYSPYFETNPYDDSFMVSKWWRFVGAGGDILINLCKAGGTGSVYTIGVDQLTMPMVEAEFATAVTAHSFSGMPCFKTSFIIDVVLCPGNFYVYNPRSHVPFSGYATWHSVCLPDSCGPGSACILHAGYGFCVCLAGYTVEQNYYPPEDVFCIDIDECLTPDICGPLANCTNEGGAYNCTCFPGYQPTIPTAISSLTNPCIDIDECLNVTICPEFSDCVNTDGSYICDCHSGFYSDPPVCKDIDECLNAAICGPHVICNNTIGLYSCECEVGYRATDPFVEPDPQNICIDVDECVENATICGANGDCSNTNGSFFCTCFPGYRLDPGLVAISDPCFDIDECSETPDVCGPLSFCVNRPATFKCACTDEHYPSTGVIWTDETTCESIPDILSKYENSEDKAFFANLKQQLKDTQGSSLNDAIVTNCFSASMEVAGVGPFVKPPKVSSAGDGEIGSIIIDIGELLIDGLVQNGNVELPVSIKTATLELSGMMFNPGDYKPKSFTLRAGEITMESNIEELAKNNNGVVQCREGFICFCHQDVSDFGAVAIMTLNGLDSLLSNQYLETENVTEFGGNVFSAFLPHMSNTNMTDPTNFTIPHSKMFPNGTVPTCAYWVIEKAEGDSEDGDELSGYSGYWSTEGCWVSYSNENFTVCSCSHFSTFALIMQMGEPPPESDFLTWLNRICVSIGLFFFALAILTFLLCSWNPKINNTARLHLCLNLGLSHLLLLFNENFYDDKLACKALAGILHFLVVASFVWMLLEAMQLYMLVHRLNKVQVIERDGLPKLVLYLIGYGVPLLIVGVSAAVYHPGYGATGGNVCWLSTTRNFNWALTGPVVTILALNLMLFCATLWSLRTTLANMRSGASNSKDTRLVLFKIVAQFVILGCTWILGLYQANLFFQILFIVLNSQQGTFLYIVHCLLNKEIREECLKCLSCSHRKEKDKTVSTTEDMDVTK